MIECLQRFDKMSLYLGGYDNAVIYRKKYYSIKKLIGKKNLIDENDYQAIYSANPEKLVYLHISTKNMTDDSDLNINVEIKMT